MESGRGSGGGLRSGSGGKKMRKRKELDALVGGVSGGKRVGNGNKRAGSGGISPQDQLLSESTGEEEYWHTKGKGRRRYVGSGRGRSGKPCQALLRACTVLLIMACLVATLTVMWLFIDIREQTAYLHNQLDQVAAGSQGVPDALQKCHSLSRELQNNQTKLFSQLSTLSQQLSNFSSQIGKVQGGLANVEGKLLASPELVNVPHELQGLSASLAEFGSQIQDLQTTSAHLKEEHSTILESLKGLQLNISGINKVVLDFSKTPILDTSSSPKSEMIDNDKKLEALINDLKINVSSLNEILSHDLQWAHKDQHSDHKLIEDLQEVSANVSSQITTIQNEMTTQKNKLVEIEKSLIQVNTFKTHVLESNIQLGNLNERCNKLENITNRIGEELVTLKSYTGSHSDVAEQNLTIAQLYQNSYFNNSLIAELQNSTQGNTTSI